MGVRLDSDGGQVWFDANGGQIQQVALQQMAVLLVAVHIPAFFQPRPFPNDRRELNSGEPSDRDYRIGGGAPRLGLLPANTEADA